MLKICVCLKNIVLKYLIICSVFFIFLGKSFSQNLQLKIYGSNEIENLILDSLNYSLKHKNIKSIQEEIIAIQDKLNKKGFIENQILSQSKINDSLYDAKFLLGKRIKFVTLYIGRKIQEETSESILQLIGFSKKNTSLVLPFSEIENFLTKTKQRLQENGFAFATLQLINLKKINQNLEAKLHFDFGQQRIINEIQVKFTENVKNNFPESHLKQLNRKFKKSIFNEDLVKKIEKEFEQFGFVSQIKSPEVLFTRDATTIYVYLDKKKANSFDGYLGFANNNNNNANELTFNGYLDLNIKNAIKAGEQFELYWKSDGNNQKTFKSSIDLPYIFKTSLGLKAQIDIFKQDSIFQNTKTAIDLGYFINYKSRIYVGYQATESSDIQNTNNSFVSDFKNSFLTTNFEYSQTDNKQTLFRKKTNLALQIGFGKRTNAVSGQVNQVFVKINAMRNFFIHPKHCLNLNYHNYFLKSNFYVSNELFRFGGIKTIRGFAENSLQTNFMNAIMSEYRYIVSPQLYLHSFIDYGFFEDKSTNYQTNLLGLGIGLGLQTKNGQLRFNLTNGKNKTDKILMSKTIVNLNYALEF